MSIINTNYSGSTGGIALATLVKPFVADGKQKYSYEATRVYDPLTGRVYETVLQVDSKSDAIRYAAWNELPLLDVTKRELVGKNKERYCTLISARVYEVSDAVGGNQVSNGFVCLINEGSHVHKLTHVLGFTFMDINGDKMYIPANQIDASAILKHVHSVYTTPRNGMYMRQVNVTKQQTSMVCPQLELSDIDTNA